MLPAGAAKYRSTGTFPSSPMCVITIRVFVTKQGAPQRNIVTAPQTISTPLIQINVPKPPEKIALPVQCIRQPQTREEIPPGSTPKQCSNPPIASAAAPPPIPDSAPVLPPSSKERPEQESRRSSIRRLDPQPSSNGSRISKKVHFFISDLEDSLDSPDSQSSFLDPPSPGALPSTSAKINAMAIEDKPPTQASPSCELDKWETLSDFLSDIDDGEMVQQAVVRETQGDNDHLYRMDWGDLDSDSGSAVDGSEPALSVPIKRGVTSRPPIAQPLVRNDDEKSCALSSHPVHPGLGEQPENTTRGLKNVPPSLSGQFIPTKARPAPSIWQLNRPRDWENGSEAGSTMDDSVPAIRVPLTSYTSGNRRHVSLRSATVPPTAPGVPSNTLQGAKSHNGPTNERQAPANVPSKSPTDAAVGSPQIRPSPIFVHRRRDRRTHDIGTDGATDARDNRESESNGHAHDPVSSESQQSSCEVYYDRRTGTITYGGLRDGYTYFTRARGT